MKNLKIRVIKKVGLHPASPRWLKMFCLRITMNHIGKEFSRLIEKMTPEQRDEFNAKFRKDRMEA